VSAYMMTWVNTAPASDVTEVEMSAAGKGVPILIAITAGVDAGQAPLSGKAATP
jgi:hypothetical protein